MGAQLGEQVVKQACNWVRKLHFLGECPALRKGTFVPLYNLLFVRNKCYKQLTQTQFLTQQSLKLTVVSQNLPFPLQIKPVKVC